MAETEAKAIQTLDYTGTTPEYKEISEKQFQLINQIRALTREARENFSKLAQICPHLWMDERWPTDGDMYTVCMHCSNHDLTNWNIFVQNSLYKNITRTRGDRVREAPR